MNYIYDGSAEHDYLIEWWYHTIRLNGDLERIFPAQNRSLSSIYRLFARPTEVVLNMTENNEIRYLAWFEPSFSGVFHGVWHNPNCRGSYQSALHYGTLLLYALDTWKVILSLTKQKELLPYLRSWGYNVLGPLPQLFDGEDMWLGLLTRESFNGGIYGRWRQRRQHGSPRQAGELVGGARQRVGSVP